MLENPVDAPIKRYAPPNQRNRGVNRRKSSDKTERASSIQSSDGEKNLGTGFRSSLSLDSSDAGSNKSAYEIFHPRLIALNGCSTSEASQLLQERWKAATHLYNDRRLIWCASSCFTHGNACMAVFKELIELDERPVMYAGSAPSAWGDFRLPHQLMSAPQIDFLAELQQAMHNSNTN